MRRIIAFTLLTQLSLASTIGLEQLLENAQQPQQIEKMIEHEFNALESKSLADTQASPLTLNHTLFRSVSSIQSGFEQEIGLSKEFKLGNVQELEQKANRLNNEAMKIEKEKLLVSFSNRLKNAYHQYCLDATYAISLQEKYESFTLLYEKKKKAYAEDEIAKTELLQIELEKHTLEGQLNNFLKQVEDEKQQLLLYSSFSEQEHVSCQELYPLAWDFMIDDSSFELTNTAYNKRIQSTQTALKRQSKKIDSIEISTGYLRELERDVYGIGISVPLNFSSNKSEYERVALMQHSSALSIEYEQALIEKKYDITKLQAKLSRTYQAILNTQENIDAFNEKLLPLMKKSYKYGESSVVEYLLSQQQLKVKEEALLAQKKGYYETLFTLYNISEKR
jgi:outer membrane protein TolC